MDISPLRFVRASARGSSPTTGVIEFTPVCEDLGKFSSDVVLLSVVSFIVLDPFVDKVVSEFCKSVVDFVWNCWSFLTVVDPSEGIAVPYNRGKYSWYVHLKQKNCTCIWIFLILELTLWKENIWDLCNKNFLKI